MGHTGIRQSVYLMQYNYPFMAAVARKVHNKGNIYTYKTDI